MLLFRADLCLGFPGYKMGTYSSQGPASAVPSYSPPVIGQGPLLVGNEGEEGGREELGQWRMKLVFLLPCL